MRFTSWVHGSAGVPNRTDAIERVANIAGSESSGRRDPGGITFNLSGTGLGSTGQGSIVQILFPIPVPPIDAVGRFTLERVFCLWGCDSNTWIRKISVTDGRHNEKFEFSPPVPDHANVETTFRGIDLASDITFSPVQHEGHPVTNTFSVPPGREIFFGLCLAVTVQGRGEVWFSTCGVDLQ